MLDFTQWNSWEGSQEHPLCNRNEKRIAQAHSDHETSRAVSKWTTCLWHKILRKRKIISWTFLLSTCKIWRKTCLSSLATIILLPSVPILPAGLLAVVFTHGHPEIHVWKNEMIYNCDPSRCHACATDGYILLWYNASSLGDLISDVSKDLVPSSSKV
jgi:hypothetical protein